MKIIVTADEVWSKGLNLTEDKTYEVISYLENQGDKLVLIYDDLCQITTYNICHFKSISFED